MEYLTLTLLKEKGWTAGAIKKFLGEPEKTYKNLFGTYTKLFSAKRIEKIEKSKEFQDWFKKTKNSREAKRKAQLKTQANKRGENLNEINQLKIDIPLFKKKNLYIEAVKHYNWLWEDRGKLDKLVDNNIVNDPINSNFLNRISVNFLRHEVSSYEEELDYQYGRTGKDLAINIIRKKIYTAIMEKYPYLKSECMSQMNLRCF